LSDLHVGDPTNRAGIAALPAHPDDWLILAGDLGETEEHLTFVLDTLGPRFRKVLWVPGNHELWTLPARNVHLRGVAKYERMVELCRERGVVTPEDPYPTWDGAGGPLVVAPLFVLYDYTFRPESVAVGDAVAWAAESGIQCADELLLHPDPYPSRQAWCHARVRETEARLDAIDPSLSTVLVNHFPLRQEHAVLPAVPRFTPWCGTQKTNDWHLRFRAKVVVGGHLHIRTTRHVDGVRFEEVSLGYSRQWSRERGVDGYLREILPASA
jgi:hypothetical protein